MGYCSSTLDPAVSPIRRLSFTVVHPQGCWKTAEVLGDQEERYKKIRKHKKPEGV